ncbi:MAG: hypothetical protein HYS63_08740 [Methylocystis sp.]|nr:hypothetical protein [Methylocystis sp.]
MSSDSIDSVQPLFESERSLITEGQRASAQQNSDAERQRRRTAAEWLSEREDALDFLLQSSRFKAQRVVIIQALDTYHEALIFLNELFDPQRENALWQQINIVEMQLACAGIGSEELLDARDKSVIERDRKLKAWSRANNLQKKRC